MDDLNCISMKRIHVTDKVAKVLGIKLHPYIVKTYTTTAREPSIYSILFFNINFHANSY